VSYLFIAIVWANHHYLMRYASEATPRLLWFNFAHLFSISLLPLSTAWISWLIDPIEKIRARNGRGRDEFCAINTGA
jgi:uncharacterized membrane protein